MFDGFVRLCAATPALEVANVEKNAAEIARLALEAASQGANVCVFPELCLTGYTCGDLFLHDRLVLGSKTPRIHFVSMCAPQGNISFCFYVCTWTCRDMRAHGFRWVTE